MILARTVFQGKFGKGGELAAAMSKGNDEMGAMMEKITGARRKWRAPDRSLGFVRHGHFRSGGGKPW